MKKIMLLMVTLIAIVMIFKTPVSGEESNDVSEESKDYNEDFFIEPNTSNNISLSSKTECITCSDEAAFNISAQEFLEQLFYVAQINEEALLGPYEAYEGKDRNIVYFFSNPEVYYPCSYHMLIVSTDDNKISNIEISFNNDYEVHIGSDAYMDSQYYAESSLLAIIMAFESPYLLSENTKDIASNVVLFGQDSDLNLSYTTTSTDYDLKILISPIS